MCVKLGHAKLQLSSAKKAFSNGGLNLGGVENSMENPPYLWYG